MTNNSIIISLVVTFYRQACYVNEVLDGCWAQDYTNLEILISDDASTDNTWQLINEYVAAHPTRHAIRLNRHENNVGMMANMNWLYRNATGKLIVANDGDDISFPWRCSTIARAYSEACSLGHPVTIICSHYINFSGSMPALPVPPEESAPWKIHDYKSDLATFNPWNCLLGACLAFPKDLVEMFGDLDVNTLEQDIVYTFRSSLVGVRLAIYKPLLYYRIGGGTKKIKGHVFASRILSLSRQLLKDLRLVREQIDVQVYLHCERYLLQRIMIEERLVRYVSAKVYQKPYYFLRFVCLCPPIRESYVAVLLPRRLLNIAYRLKNHNITHKWIEKWNASQSITS
jgi:glycosyltransferase involved in cell wall biosynthesis